GWCIEHAPVHGDSKRMVLGGVREPADDVPVAEEHFTQKIELESHALPATFVLDEQNYRRSEESWSEAGRPTATVMVASTQPDTLTIIVDVSHVHRRFVAVDAENPRDTEPAAINGAGVQLYIVAGERKGGWLLVPVAESRKVGVLAIEGWEKGLTVSAQWEP